MSRQIAIDQPTLAWLRQAVATHVAISTIARHLGCCADTAKRILVRHSLAEFEGAKYALSREHEQATWTRPCSRCKTTKPRPRWQFFCTACTEIMADDSDDELGVLGIGGSDGCRRYSPHGINNDGNR